MSADQYAYFLFELGNILKGNRACEAGTDVLPASGDPAQREGSDHVQLLLQESHDPVRIGFLLQMLPEVFLHQAA
jgi:hypothetical protein